MRISGRWLAALAVLLQLTVTGAVQAQDKWVSLFDGKTLDGWEKVGSDKSNWAVADGAIQGSGDPSMLVCTKGPYRNFRYRAEIKINDKGNKIGRAHV